MTSAELRAAACSRRACRSRRPAGAADTAAASRAAESAAKSTAPKAAPKAKAGKPKAKAAPAAPKAAAAPAAPAPDIPGTKRAYMADTYRFEASATVVAVVEDHPLLGGTCVVLDETIFHAQGGGQPADVGTIAGVPVTMVKEVGRGDANGVLHAVAAGSSLAVGQKVALSVDAAQRLAFARCHSAGHLLDVAMSRIGYAALKPTKGYHFVDGPYVEYEGKIAADERPRVVDALNAALVELIAADTPTAYSWDAAGARIVDIGGESCPCGGTHVKSTGELGAVTVTRLKAKKAFLRVSYVMGGPP